MTFPLRLIILHFSHIGFTDALTFIIFTSFYIGAYALIYNDT